MRLLVLIDKAARQVWRDPVVLGLSLLTGPVFMVAMWAVLSAAPEPVVEVTGQGSLRASVVQGLEAAGIDVVSGGVGDAVEVHVSDSITVSGGGPGEATSVALVVSQAIHQRGVTVAAEDGGGGSPFETRVPGLVIFAAIMGVFSAALAVAREANSGVFVRLRLIRVGAAPVVAALGVVQSLIASTSVALTLLVAWVCGLALGWSLLSAVLVAVLVATGCVAMGLVVGALANTEQQAFMGASVLMFLMVLFSDVVFPTPSIPLGSVGGSTVDLFGLLPTHAGGRALDELLYGSGTLGHSLVELAVAGTAAVLLWIVATWIFTRRFGLVRATPKPDPAPAAVARMPRQEEG